MPDRLSTITCDHVIVGFFVQNYMNRVHCYTSEKKKKKTTTTTENNTKQTKNSKKVENQK